MQKICIKCGHIDEPKNHISGTFISELALYIVFALIASQTTWLILILPFGYSIYRLSSKKQICSKCNSKEIIPLDSPNGKRLIEGKELI